MSIVAITTPTTSTFGFAAFRVTASSLWAHAEPEGGPVGADAASCT